VIEPVLHGVGVEFGFEVVDLGLRERCGRAQLEEAAFVVVSGVRELTEMGVDPAAQEGLFFRLGAEAGPAGFQFGQ
jgi:hypothetical protein